MKYEDKLLKNWKNNYLYLLKTECNSWHGWFPNLTRILAGDSNILKRKQEQKIDKQNYLGIKNNWKMIDLLSKRGGIKTQLDKITGRNVVASFNKS